MSNTPVRSALAAACLALVLGACAGSRQPEVSHTVTTDAMGRKVVHYRICKDRGFFLASHRVCRTETVVLNYCYATIGSVNCYATPIPGRLTVGAVD